MESIYSRMVRNSFLFCDGSWYSFHLVYDLLASSCSRKRYVYLY